MIALEYLIFRRMLTPIIVQVLFWCTIAGNAVASLATIAAGLYAMTQIRDGAGFAAFFQAAAASSLVVAGGVSFVVVPFAARVACEVLIVFFRINETLTAIEVNTRSTREGAK